MSAHAGVYVDFADPALARRPLLSQARPNTFYQYARLSPAQPAPVNTMQHNEKTLHAMVVVSCHTIRVGWWWTLPSLVAMGVCAYVLYYLASSPLLYRPPRCLLHLAPSLPRVLPLPISSPTRSWLGVRRALVIHNDDLARTAGLSASTPAIARHARTL